MGLIRTAECERIDEEMRALFPEFVGGETRKDEYSEDFVVRLEVAVGAESDLEVWAAEQLGVMFRAVYGKGLVVVRGSNAG